MNKIFFILFFLMVINVKGFSQDQTTVEQEEKLEDLTEANDSETEDDSYMQTMAAYQRNPLNINSCSEDELKNLQLLTEIQVKHFITYRNTLGKFISIYELQAIPYWDIPSIRKVLPYLTISSSLIANDNFRTRMTKGEHEILIRGTQGVEQATGFDKSSSSNTYLGSPQQIFFRYRYNYKNILQYGVLGDKDAGETIFGKDQPYGFDFYSAHIFVRNIGALKSLAIGDFTVNLGQGLIQWQGQAFGKSSEIVNIKRQGAVLNPYRSAGEYNFHRGAGVTLKIKKFEFTGFGSLRNLSASYNMVTDVNNDKEEYFSSFQTSGYHRTVSELQDKNILQQISFGGNLKFSTNNFHIGVNHIQYKFSIPYQKDTKTYSQYSIQGDSWSNSSIDYSLTYRNFHVFGEAATDKKYNIAIVNGMLISLHPKVDMSWVYRWIDKQYQSINGNAFTQATFPNNEKGFFIGLSVRPSNFWTVNAYVDLYKNDWLKYTTDAPSIGKDYLVQITYKPTKQVTVYTRFKLKGTQKNSSNLINTPLHQIINEEQMSWRMQFNVVVNPSLQMRSRVEWMQYTADAKENGFLMFADAIYKPFGSPVSGNIRLQYFETDSYNSRIYAFESDVLYGYSIPAFYDKGFRYYLNLRWIIAKKLNFYLRWSSTIYSNKTSVGSGLDQINGNTKSQIRTQIIFDF